MSKMKHVSPKGTSPRKEEETPVLSLLGRIAEAFPAVLSVWLCGSRAAGRGKSDAWSDWDVVFVTRRPGEYPEIAARIQEAFAPVVVTQTPDRRTPADLRLSFHWLMQFRSVRIDLTLTSRDMFSRALSGEPYLKEIWTRPGELPPPPPAPEFLRADDPFFPPPGVPAPPAQEEFSDCANEFWWVTCYVLKGLARGELLYASAHLETCLRKEFLRMAAFEAGAKGLAPGKCFQNLPLLLGKEDFARYLSSCRAADAEEIGRSLRTLAALFSECAERVARLAELRYDAEEERRVREFCGLDKIQY